MADVQIVTPSPPIAEFVRWYEYRAMALERESLIRPIWARPHIRLVFSLRDGCEAFEYLTLRTRLLPVALLVGAITRRVADVALRGQQMTFTVVFQPGGLYRLFGARASELTDRAHSAQEILGRQIEVLTDWLREAQGLEAKVAVTERFLLQWIGAARPLDSVHHAAALLLRAHGGMSLSALMRASGSSGVRELERRFLEHIGTTPKRYARIARLDFALRLKSQNQALTWMAISHEAGYFDQNHLVKDFKAMTGQLPSSYARTLTATP